MGDRYERSATDAAPGHEEGIVETTIRDSVLKLHRPGTEWLSTGWNGGRSRASAAYNVSVPEGFDRTDLGTYLEERFERAGIDAPAAAPALVTGVDLKHARIARSGPAAVVATAGISNPAALFPDGEPAGDGSAGEDPSTAGTVNVLAVVDRGLPEGALANLVAVAAEAKTATLDRLADVPGTTTDAVVVGCDPDGEPAEFSGSATPVGAAVRACVRDAVHASFESRYADRAVPGSVADAEYGVVTDRETEVAEL